MGKSSKQENGDKQASEEDIEIQLDSILHGQRIKLEGKTQRSDVLHKTILRGFKRFISSLFISGRSLPRIICESPYLSKKALLTQAVDLGLVSPDSKADLTSEYNEFVCWLAMGKSTTKMRKQFSMRNASINIMDTCLKSFSHQKCKQLICDENFRQVFAYFRQHGLEKFLANQGSKREDFELTLTLF